jgi:hypothetical protein
MKKGYFNLWCLSVVFFSSAIVVCAENNNNRELNRRKKKQQWLWNTAKIMGPLGLGLIALGAYQWYKSSPINAEQQIITPPPVPSNTPVPLNTQEISFVEPKKQIATPEDVAKYFKASKAYGASAVYFTILALFDPFFYPYVAATYMGSLYYGIKGVQPRLYPVSLKEITITPPDLPY